MIRVHLLGCNVLRPQIATFGSLSKHCSKIACFDNVHDVQVMNRLYMSSVQIIH